jgi:hypothetical protein
MPLHEGLRSPSLLFKDLLRNETTFALRAEEGLAELVGSCWKVLRSALRRGLKESPRCFSGTCYAVKRRLSFAQRERVLNYRTHLSNPGSSHCFHSRTVLVVL